jgi:hypothetical protein
MLRSRSLQSDGTRDISCAHFHEGRSIFLGTKQVRLRSPSHLAMISHRAARDSSPRLRSWNTCILRRLVAQQASSARLCTFGRVAHPVIFRALSASWRFVQSQRLPFRTRRPLVRRTLTNQGSTSCRHVRSQMPDVRMRVEHFSILVRPMSVDVAKLRAIARWSPFTCAKVITTSAGARRGQRERGRESVRPKPGDEVMIVVPFKAVEVMRVIAVAAKSDAMGSIYRPTRDARDRR